MKRKRRMLRGNHQKHCREFVKSNVMKIRKRVIEIVKHKKDQARFMELKNDLYNN